VLAAAALADNFAAQRRVRLVQVSQKVPVPVLSVLDADVEACVCEMCGTCALDSERECRRALATQDVECDNILPQAATKSVQ
jgi:hypothetical protein